jgi:SNF2 family DNA or RNA helicase
MGLGKTMEMISLSLSNKPNAEYSKIVGTKIDTKYYSRATFVHCPNHLARQWKEEVQKNTKSTVAVITTIKEFSSYSIEDLCSKFGKFFLHFVVEEFLPLNVVHHSLNYSNKIITFDLVSLNRIDI